MPNPKLLHHCIASPSQIVLVVHQRGQLLVPIKARLSLYNAQVNEDHLEEECDTLYTNCTKHEDEDEIKNNHGLISESSQRSLSKGILLT